MPSRLTSPHYRHTKGRIAKGRGSEGETTRKQLTACASACAAPHCGVAVNALTSPWRFMIALFFGHSEAARWLSKPERFRASQARLTPEMWDVGAMWEQMSRGLCDVRIGQRCVI